MFKEKKKLRMIAPHILWSTEILKYLSRGMGCFRPHFIFYFVLSTCLFLSIFPFFSFHREMIIKKFLVFKSKYQEKWDRQLIDSIRIAHIKQNKYSTNYKKWVGFGQIKKIRVKMLVGQQQHPCQGVQSCTSRRRRRHHHLPSALLCKEMKTE